MLQLHPNRPLLSDGGITTNPLSYKAFPLIVPSKARRDKEDRFRAREAPKTHPNTLKPGMTRPVDLSAETHPIRGDRTTQNRDRLFMQPNLNH